MQISNKSILLAYIALTCFVRLSPAQNQVLCRAGRTGTVPCAKPLPPDFVPPLDPNQITGSAPGRVLIDTGTQGDWLGPSPAGSVLTSAGPGLPLLWQLPAPATPTGSAVVLMVMGNGAALSSWAANQYAGLGSVAGSNVNPLVGAWQSPCTGSLRNWYYASSLANPSGAGRVVTVYRAPAAVSGGCGVYAATAVTLTMPLAGQGAFSATTLAVTQGDCILFRQNFTLNTGAGGATTISALHTCN